MLFSPFREKYIKPSSPLGTDKRFPDISAAKSQMGCRSDNSARNRLFLSFPMVWTEVPRALFVAEIFYFRRSPGLHESWGGVVSASEDKLGKHPGVVRHAEVAGLRQLVVFVSTREAIGERGAGASVSHCPCVLAVRPAGRCSGRWYHSKNLFRSILRRKTLPDRPGPVCPRRLGRLGNR